MNTLKNYDTIILDRGHATLNKDGKYATPGKQYTFPDGLHVYEGYENQKYVEALAIYAQARGLKIAYTVSPNNPADISLTTRVKTANSLSSKANAIYVSVHNNAGGGEGTEVFTSIGNTKSDLFAESVINFIAKAFPNRKMRTDTRDGDKDKEDNFYVLKNTAMPAILIEYGFFDNRKDYDFLSDKKTIKLMAEATIDGILNAIQTK